MYVCMYVCTYVCMCIYISTYRWISNKQKHARNIQMHLRIHTLLLIVVLINLVGYLRIRFFYTYDYIDTYMYIRAHEGT